MEVSHAHLIDVRTPLIEDVTAGVGERRALRIKPHGVNLMEESPGRAPSLTAHLARGRHSLNVLHGSEERFNAVDATQRGFGKTPESSPGHPLERKSNRSELRRQAESASPGRVSHMVQGAEVINVPIDWTNPSEVRKTAARVVVPAARVAELTNDENPLRLSRKMATRVVDA